MDLVFQPSRRLLGDAVHARFGTSLHPLCLPDTWMAGNLSFQVASAYRVHTRPFGDALHADESYTCSTCNKMAVIWD